MNKNNSSILIYIFLISLLELLLIFLIKYDLNSVAIAEFNIFYIGNIIPLSLQVLLFIFLIGQLFSKNSIPLTHQFVLFILSTVSLTFLLASYLANKLGFSFPNEYIFNYPFERVIPGFALMASFFIKVYLLTLLLNLFFNNGFVVYVKSLLTTIFVFVIAIALIFVLSTKNGYDNLEIKQSNKAVAVVLGAAVWNTEPSTLFKGRIIKASELLKNRKKLSIQNK